MRFYKDSCLYGNDKLMKKSFPLKQESNEISIILYPYSLSLEGLRAESGMVQN